MRRDRSSVSTNASGQLPDIRPMSCGIFSREQTAELSGNSDFSLSTAMLRSTIKASNPDFLRVNASVIYGTVTTVSPVSVGSFSTNAQFAFDLRPLRRHRRHHVTRARAINDRIFHPTGVRV